MSEVHFTSYRKRAFEMQTYKDLEFKPLTATDMPKYSKFFGLRDNKTCDSVGLEAFIWKNYYNVRVALVRKEGEEIGIVWLMGDADRPFSAMPMCRAEDLEYCLRLSIDYFKYVLGMTFKILLADEAAMEELQLNPEEFLVELKEDARDYLYSAEALRTLSGKKLHKKKNHYNKFVKSYEGRYEYRRLGCHSREEVFQFLELWRISKGEDVEKHLDPEVEGIHDILKHCATLDIKMGGVFVDNQLEAFSIGSLNERENMAIIHIEKANPEIPGLYQFINKEFLSHEFPNVEIVNREDDLGIEGLRKAKESYHPIGYANKYYVEYRG